MKFAWARRRRARLLVVCRYDAPCPYCTSRRLKQDGRAALGGQRFRCCVCRRTSTDRSATPFAGYRWPREVIVTAVRWYFPFRLSLADVRDLEHILTKLGLSSRAQIAAWVAEHGLLRESRGAADP